MVLGMVPCPSTRPQRNYGQKEVGAGVLSGLQKLLRERGATGVELAVSSQSLTA